MAFKVTRVTTAKLVADERLYLTSDLKRVVGEGDPGAAILLAAKGQIIPGTYAHLLEEPSPTPESAPTTQRRKTRIEEPKARE